MTTTKIFNCMRTDDNGMELSQFESELVLAIREADAHFFESTVLEFYGKNSYFIEFEEGYIKLYKRP